MIIGRQNIVMWIIVISVMIVLFGQSDISARVYTIERGNNLQAAINNADDGDTLVLGAKTFEAMPTEFVDSLCGNCEEHRTEVTASYGFIIKDKSLVILGQDRKQTVLKTSAGYGLYFVDSKQSYISNLTVTGGKRDADGNATDAAIVVRRSRVCVRNCNIVDNDNLIDSVVVGIGGVFGREGADIIIEGCDIINNGWDGVALYRGATAIVSDCLIKDGRGVGIGVTWDATCIAYRNRVTGYWKGIGAFGTSWVMARNNAVYDNLGWGIIATGGSYMDIANNVVFHNGNCGVAPWSIESRGRIVNNIIVNNGWRKEWVCPCVGVKNFGDWAKWEFAHNIVFGNKEGNYRDIWDQTDINGNLSVDPGFSDDSTFFLMENSPAIDAGLPEIYDLDGSCSDIGLFGGPQAR